MRTIADAYVGWVLSQGREMPSVLDALAGSPSLERVKQDYQRVFIAKCRTWLTLIANRRTEIDGRFRAIIGAADARAEAAATGQIDAAARAKLYRTILTVVARSGQDCQ